MGTPMQPVRGGKSGIDARALVDGQILYDLENKSIYLDHVVNNELVRTAFVRQPFSGTIAQWEALTDAQKAQYAGTEVNILDDFVQANDDFVPASESSAGMAGLVPAPAAGDQNKVLFGDGTWRIVESSAYDVTKGTVGSASEGVDVDLSYVTSWDAGAAPTLGTNIDADEIDSWSAGALPIFTYDSANEHVIYTAGTLPSLSYTGKAIPNVTSVGSVPTLTHTDKTLPRIVITPTTVVTDVTESD